VSDIVWLPSSDAVLSEIQPICALLWDALETGTLEAARYFEKNPYDPSFYPSFVRYRAKTYLHGLGIMAFDEQEPADVALRRLPNIGLQLRYRDYEIRVRKSDNKPGQKVPPAGNSIRTQQFYRQERPYLPFDERELQRALGGWNLLALWTPNILHRLAGMDIALTSDGGTTRDSTKTHWSVPLPKALVAPAVDHDDEDLQVTPARVVADDAAAATE
jgi:hypothetical protein